MSFPSNACSERETAIIDLVKAGNCKYAWSTITSTYKEHQAEFYTFSDALKIPIDSIDVRANVSAQTQQKIADMLGHFLLTTKLADLIWLQRAFTLPPFPRQITSSTAAMIEHSKKIDDELARLLYTEGLICTTGKHWVIDNDTLSHAGKSCNYGWHFIGQSFQGIKGEICAGMMKDASGQYMRLIQGRGWAHDIHHVDYSQICVLVAQPCVVDGSPMNFDDVAKDKELSYLVNYGGVLKVIRQPGV
jgi:hypothetical protein